jgi:signal peptidase II
MPKVSVSADWCRAVCLFTAIALAGTAADLLSKHWVFQALSEMEPGAVYWIWQDIFGFQLSLNTGGLLGFAGGWTAVLSLFSLIFLVGIIGFVVLWGWRSLFLTVILGMITAGICGNLYDRLGWHGLVYPEGHPLSGESIYAVRDWILCMIGTFPYPNFNIADSLLVCSIILLLTHELLFNKESKESAPEPAA